MSRGEGEQQRVLLAIGWQQKTSGENEVETFLCSLLEQDKTTFELCLCELTVASLLRGFILFLFFWKKHGTQVLFLQLATIAKIWDFLLPHCFKKQQKKSNYVTGSAFKKYCYKRTKNTKYAVSREIVDTGAI